MNYNISNSFYFVSDSSEVIDLLVFFVCFFTPIFSNLRMKVFLTIFLHSMCDLDLKYDMIIFCSGILADFRIFSGFIRIFIKSSDFSVFNHISWSVPLSCTIWWYTFRIFFRFSDSSGFSGFFQFHRILLKYSDFINFNQISSEINISNLSFLFFNLLTFTFSSYFF